MEERQMNMKSLLGEFTTMKTKINHLMDSRFVYENLIKQQTTAGIKLAVVLYTKQQ